MNHAGEITPLTKLVRPHVAIVTTIEPVHLEYFGSLEKIADAKAEIFAGVEPGGAAVLNRDNAQYGRLAAAAKAAGVARIVSFGEHAQGRGAACCATRCKPNSSTVEADILGQHVTYKLGAPGRHLVLNSLAVLAAVRARRRRSRARRARARASFSPPTGRGARADARRAGRQRAADRRELQRQPGLDAGGDRAARPGAGRRARPPHRRARRHAGTRRAGRRACTAAWPSRSPPPGSTWCSAPAR